MLYWLVFLKINYSMFLFTKVNATRTNIGIIGQKFIKVFIQFN